MKRILVFILSTLMLIPCFNQLWSLVPQCKSEKDGTVTIISNGKEYELYKQLTHAVEHTPSGTISISIAFTPIKELLDILPEIQYADDFQIIFSGNDTARYTLYNKKAEHLFSDNENNYYPYLNAEKLSFPDKPGVYILEISKHYKYMNGESFYHYLSKIKI